MGDIHDDLREVMGLLGKATGGKWYAVRVEQETPAMPPTHAVTIGPSWVGLDKGRALDADDAEAMVAAVTFLRQHGPALLARQEGEDARDAARYRWLREWYLRGGKRSELDPLGHIRYTTPAIMDASIDAARSGGGG